MREAILPFSGGLTRARSIALLLGGFVAMLALPLFISTFWMRILTGTLMWIGLAQSWNIIAGYTGYINFGHGAFFGIGAYVTGLLIRYQGWPLLAAIWVGGLAAGIVAFVIGYPTLRLRGAYFAIATWAFAEMVRQAALVSPVTGGAYGMRLPAVLNETFFYVVMLSITTGTLLATHYFLERAAFGYWVKAIRENEGAAQSLGINTVATKIAAFAASTCIAGVYGGVYGYWLTYVHPDNVLHPMITDQMVVMALVGGLGTFGGPMVGATLLYWVNRLIWLNWGDSILYLIVLGILICLVVVFMPDGILGLFRSRRLGARGIRDNLRRLGEKVKV